MSEIHTRPLSADMTTRKARGARKPTAGSTAEIPSSLIDTVCRRLARNQRVRRTLPGRGRLHVDRQLPFLCVYRRPPDGRDAGTERLVKSEASYLVAPGDDEFHESVTRLAREVVKTLSAEFGAFLIVEIWAGPDGGHGDVPSVATVRPTFTVYAAAESNMTRTVDALQTRLRRVKVLKHAVNVEVVRNNKCHPPDLPPLLTALESSELNCSFLGLSVPPVYRKRDSTEEFPLVVRSLRRSVSLALRQAYYEFARSRTTHRPPHYHALGRKAVVKAVWQVDRQLAEVSNQFDYLLQVTPVNAKAAWNQFQQGRFECVPEFHYRPLPVDPSLLKRELYRIPVERVEDPALQRIFQEKQEELELKLTMLRDRDTPRFLYESLQLFGGVRDTLLRLAHDLLSRLPRSSDRSAALEVGADALAERVEMEFDFYRQSCPDFKARAVVTPEVAGPIVSRGRLLINSDLSVPPSRIDALLAHEVGTHLLTYYNGRMQPFQQLYSGLAGYEELQEGLGVLSEYLVGGLSTGRMRQLAARVVAVRHLTDGATFVETFRALHNELGFSPRAAYNITMRVYRGGGLTKDAVYLRGLEAILQYVKKGGELGPLLAGKIAVQHIPIIRELQYRNVLIPAPITPRHLREPAAVERLERLCDSDCSVVDLVFGTPAAGNGTA